MYVIYVKELNRCKVGRSLNPKKRTRGIVTQSGFSDVSIYISDPVIDSCACEKEAHKKLNGFKFSNEWFSCDYKFAIDIVKAVVSQLGEKETDRMSLKNGFDPKFDSPLRRLRKKAKMTLHQLSDLSGVAVTQIQAVETEKSDPGNMAARNLLAIAKALNADPYELIGRLKRKDL